jgi:lipoprotein-anchoring transpeptidase ErfK/SrfK
MYTPYFIHVSSNKQKLYLYRDGKLINNWMISTGKNGFGEQENSEKTPRGWHIIQEKYGNNLPLNSVLVARKPTGEVYDANLATTFPSRDWILTRILRLQGLEQGFNIGAGIDTYNRMIYLHGTPDNTLLGQPGSRGCIRMKNSEIIELFKRVPIGTKLLIK